jgi:ATP-binding cassette, subfamily B, heavy metal transporter
MRGMGRAPDPDDDVTPDLRIVQRLLPHLWAHWRRISLALAFLIAAKLATVTLPMVMKHLVDGLSADPTVLVLPLALLLAYGLLRWASGLFGELRDIAFGHVGERVVRRVSGAVLAHLHRLELAFHLDRRTGALSREIERGQGGISFLLRFMLFNIVPTVLEIGMVAVILGVAYGPLFALMTAVSVVVYLVFSVSVTQWRTRFLHEANRHDADANTRAIDSLLNYETVKYFNAEDREARAYDAALAVWERAQLKTRLSLAGLNIGQGLIIAVAMTAMMLLAAQGVVDGSMTLGDFVAVNAYMMQLFIPLNLLGFVYREIRRALADMSRMFSLLDREPAQPDAPHALDLPAGPVHLAFDGVAFAYRADRPLLHDISFDLAPGRTVAFVGATGSGKSSIARLVFGFYAPQSGVIRFNGAAAADWTLASVRRQIAVVPQEPVLFNTTLGDNIAYGAEAPSAERLQEVIAQADLAEWVAQLPQGLDTRVGERGLKLSGGEKQRVALARALLKPASIMLLDEASSALDGLTERRVLDALHADGRQRSALIIAHRLSTVAHADEIIVLDRGRIVECGRHAALVAQDGLYAEMWHAQARERTAVAAEWAGPAAGDLQEPSRAGP